MKRNLNDIKGQIEELKKYCEQNKNILALYIFGSYGTELERITSDIDLAMLFRNSPSLFEELEIESDISQIFGRDNIDLVNLNKAPLDICHQVLYTGDLLYCTDEIALADFKEKVFNAYGDYGITLKKFYDDYMKGLRDKYA
ncbi:type VII toxin-antitoxin system MntA family adenylyltransferase antitoxin [Carboxydothermus hydrogenoformans]|uniref:Nucleotidyltransferase domain protein n=1 Tax=Carboxydothermus hydrogenoformans (strain ATCC BAA-161 / DSM 6008 / Z-2901) TaxID=246194 RepID=Q3AAW8_CARHZ|nr:nucleotidyltransferase domain-containing protein [Carboxydothermus hydrogenoformans]ABB14467.1 nucleotidyltransferase domain protein [Carboxydothermus hydrogenoformans Z-2901]